MLARDEEDVAGEQEEGGAPGELPDVDDRGVVAGFDSSPWVRRAAVSSGEEGTGRTGGAGAWENERFGLGYGVPFLATLLLPASVCFSTDEFC